MKKQFFWRWRYPIAALALVSGMIAFAAAFLPSSPQMQVLVAARDIHAGQTLQKTDFKTASLPSAAVSGPTMSSAHLSAGAFAAVDLPAGTVMQPGFILGDTWSQVRPGEVGLALELGDNAGAQMARPGQKLEVWASTGGQSSVVAPQVRVLGVRAPTDSFLSTSPGSPVLLLTTSEDQARAILSARADAQLSFVVRG